MGIPELIDELEADTGEDPITSEIPAAEPAAGVDDLGDAAPAGQEHPLADVVDPKLGIDPVDFVPIPVSGGDGGGSVLVLNTRERLRARDLAVQAAVLAVLRNRSIQYTMGPKRWDPIARDRKAWRGETDAFQDCSSFATWCLWNGLDHFGIGDVVNGQRFAAGWTGSTVQHGERVPRANVLRGDCLFYADAAGAINHVTIYVGGGMVISHGSEPGPSKLRMDYRPIVQIRRYIR